MSSHRTALPQWGSAADADEALTLLRHHGPVEPVRLPDGPDVWLVTRYHEARLALADPRLVKDPRRLEDPSHGFGGCRYRDDLWAVFGHHILNTEGAEHQRRRLVYRHFLGPRIVERYRLTVERLAGEHINALASGSSADLLRDFGEPLAAAALAHVLGLPDRFVPEMARCGSAVARGDDPTDASQLLVDLRELVLAVLANRAHLSPDGMVAALLRLHQNQEWALREVADEIGAAIIAGTSTTAAFLAHACAVIADDDRLRQYAVEPEMAPALIEELLRYRSVVFNTTWRFAIETLRLGEVTIPQGAVVLVSIASANRDECVYSAADTVDPLGDHNTVPHLGFGYGQHFCAGAALARLVATIALPALFRCFPKLVCTVPLLDLEWQIAVVGWRPTTVPILLNHKPAHR